MMMLAPEPGVPEELDVWRPDTAPSRDLDMSEVRILDSFSPLTWAAEPVKDDFFCTP